MKKVLESDYFQQVSYLIDERFCLQKIFFYEEGNRSTFICMPFFCMMHEV